MYVCIQGFNLSEDDVLRMRSVYDDIIGGRKISKVRITEVYTYIVSDVVKRIFFCFACAAVPFLI